MPKFEELCDVHSESGIVATIMNMPDMVNFSENLKGTDFMDKANGVIYDVVTKLFANDVYQIDAFNISTAIGADEKLKRRLDVELSIPVLSDIIENSKYLARGTSEEYVMLVNNVMGMAYRRTLFKKIDKAKSNILRESDIITLQKDLISDLEQTTEKYITGNEIDRFGDKIDEIYQRLCDKRGKDGAVGYKFMCVPELNNYLTMEKKEMTTFLAPMKSGKSMIMMNAAFDCIRQGAKVLFLDTEMSDELFAQRLICYLAKVSMRDFKGGTLTEEEHGNVEKAKKIIKEAPLWHSYIPNYTMDGIYGTVKTMNRKYGCDTLFFDYLKASSATDAYGAYAELGNLTNMLKNQIAGDLNMTVVSACQASKNGGIADSVRIGQYSSTIIKIRKKSRGEIETDGEKCGNYRMTVLYNRLGGQHIEDEDWVDAQFFGDYCTFEPCEQHNSEEIFG